MTYTEYINKQLDNYAIGQPIYTFDLANGLANVFCLEKKEANAATAVTINRLLKTNKFLRFYQNGIYYLTKSTVFGEVEIAKEAIIYDKYLKNDNGYETGYYFLHKIGLTTQLPNECCIVSNAAKDCKRKDNRLGITVKPPKEYITANNKNYFQLLDVLDLMDKAPIDAEKPYLLLANHIKENNLEYKTLLSLARKYYNNKTIINLAYVASEGDKYETTPGR